MNQEQQLQFDDIMALVTTEVKKEQFEAKEQPLKAQEEATNERGCLEEAHIKTEPPETTHESVEHIVKVKKESPDNVGVASDLQDPQFIPIKREPSEDGDSDDIFPEEEDPLLPDPFADDGPLLFSSSSEVPARTCDVLIKSTADGAVSSVAKLPASAVSTTGIDADIPSIKSEPTSTETATTTSEPSAPTSAASSATDSVAGTLSTAANQSLKRNWDTVVVSELETKIEKAEKIFQLKKRILEAEFDLEKLKYERRKFQLESYRRLLKFQSKYQEME